MSSTSRHYLVAPLGICWTITLFTLLPGCKESPDWLIGSWLLVDGGKPGVCHQFNKNKSFAVYVGSECSGATDPLLSGKWQLRGKGKLALQRGNEEVAHLAVISERSASHFVSSGAISGTLYKVTGKVTTLIGNLEQKGALTLRALPPELGCQQLGRPIDEIRQLPKEKEPRMLRARDQGLEYHVDRPAGDPLVEKVVYALNLDQIDWISFNFGPAAFGAPGPGGRLSQHLGQAEGEASTGKETKRQLIGMWKGYCKSLRGVANKDIDVTLFSSPGKKQAYYYVSEGIITEIWEELKQAASDPTQQADDEEEGEEEEEEAIQAAPAPAAPPPPAASPPPATAPPPPPPAAPPPEAAAPEPAPPAPAPPAAKTPARPSGSGLAVPGGEDEI